jgi:Inhibitor of growth proteins N-terminal histone-binding
MIKSTLVVEQLPLELHRNFHLLTELEHQMQCVYFIFLQLILYMLIFVCKVNEKGLQTKLLEYLSMFEEPRSSTREKAQLSIIAAQNEFNEIVLSNDIQNEGSRSENGEQSNLKTPVASKTDIPDNEDRDSAMELEEELSPQSKQHQGEKNSSKISPQNPDQEYLGSLLGKVAEHTRAAIRHGEDKVGLAITMYDWVSTRQ